MKRKCEKKPQERHDVDGNHQQHHTARLCAASLKTEPPKLVSSPHHLVASRGSEAATGGRRPSPAGLAQGELPPHLHPKTLPSRGTSLRRLHSTVPPETEAKNAAGGHAVGTSYIRGRGESTTQEQRACRGSDSRNTGRGWRAALQHGRLGFSENAWNKNGPKGSTQTRGCEPRRLRTKDHGSHVGPWTFAL